MSPWKKSDGSGREFPIDLNRHPYRADALTEVAKVIESLPLLITVGAGDRAVLTIVAETAQFLDGLLSSALVVDDEGSLSLSDDQSAAALGPLSFEDRVRVLDALAAVENVVDVLRQRLAADSIDVEPLPVDNNLGHENSPLVGAAQTVHGLGVLEPTVGDATDTAAASPAAPRVGGLQDGATVPPIAAASTPGGDAASSPNRAASLPATTMSLHGRSEVTKPFSLSSLLKAEDLMERKYGPQWWEERRLRTVPKRLAAVIFQRREARFFPWLALLGGVAGAALVQCFVEVIS